MSATRTAGKPWGLDKVVSGGQTGVDRAALDVALERHLAVGGWCPKGRRAEDGPIPLKYPLQETPTANYAERTALNVKESDGTLILVRGPVSGGTALTRTFAARYGRPCLVIDLRDGSPLLVRDWLMAHAIRVLNVAGPRESSAPGITRQATTFLRQLFAVMLPPKETRRTSSRSRATPRPST